jgi:hypothetical protein
VPEGGTPCSRIRAAAVVAKIELERTSFRTLLLSNPNYFGTLKGSKLKAVKALSGNTSYEQLMCVGLHPQLSQLEAVVHVKKNAGYNESLCGGGSPEYVRFRTLVRTAPGRWTRRRWIRAAAWCVCTPTTGRS